MNGNDFFGFDQGVRAMPSGIPNNKIVRQGIYTPDVGYNPDQITSFGRQFGNQWVPTMSDGAPGQNWGAVFGNRFGNLGVVASVTHSYKENYVEEQRAFYRIGDSVDDLEAISDYHMKYGTQKAQLGAVANLAYQFTSNNRVSFENFYSHSGKDEGRVFEGPNTENIFYYYNNRLSYIEEGLLSTALTGDHVMKGLGDSRFDWRVNVASASRDEPDLRETLYQQPFLAGTTNPNPAIAPVLADESQSGFRLFNDLDRRYDRRAVQLEPVLQHGFAADAVQVGFRLRQSHTRLPVAPLPLHPDRADQGRRADDRPDAAARAALHHQQHRHGVPLQRRDAAG